MNNLSSHFDSLGFIGAGNMAGAILRGTVGRSLLAADRVWACDILPEKLTTLASELRIHTTTNAREVASNVTTIILAVKPQDLPAMLEIIAPALTAEHRIISIAAGIRTETIAKKVSAPVRIVRVMPNTPALVGCGAAGVAAGPNATQADIDAALALFGAVGLAVQVTEDQLDAVTALSGSGPAYVFRLMELMADAGVELGLDPNTAGRLAVKTVLGSAILAEQSGETPAVLRQRVTSKGGTTAAALAVFEERGLPQLIKDAMKAALERSVELSKQ
ncbi:pyrroline-5-carboxylate reductase [bacterium]|nr:pyrroline-5-carboxylate reductase [bacterium]